MGEKFITQEGLEKIKEELESLKKNERPALIQRIKDAKELGDLSENADYQSAKEEQSFLEGHIQELEELIKHGVIVTKSKSNAKVSVGSVVKIKTGSTIKEYTITGSKEADPLKGKISNESPLGSKMMEKKVGDEFTFKTPNGENKYSILEIN